MMGSALFLLLLAADDPLKDRFKASKSKVDWGCQNVTVWSKENRTQCRGHAWVTRDDLSIKCDILEVITDEKRNPKKITCIENVLMKTADGESRSEKAEYDAVKEVITLTGHPQLKRGESTMSFETMIYDVKREMLRGTMPRGTMAPEQKK